MNIFSKNKIYSFHSITEICDKNALITVDCLKDENMVSIEKYWDGELGGDCLFEFHQIKDDKFKLAWLETNSNLMPKFSSSGKN